jgi:predicted phage terminase large subunit-like protein
VCTTWYVRGTDYYIVEVNREKLIYPDLKQKIVDLALQFNAIPIIEDKGSGIDLIRDLRRTSPVKPIPFNPQGDKLSRAMVQSAKIAAGHVHLRSHRPWFNDFKSELMQFPNGRHDDQVDSLTQFLAWIEQRQLNRAFTFRLGELGIG